jgi:RNA polymerase sigma-70 factor (ECF subfamily)
MQNSMTCQEGVTNAGEAFVRAFNEARSELLSTLFFILGNHQDAQDSSQDTFIKCWRERDSLGTVRNLRAWIFRVGINAAKDLRRNAWRRRARPVTAEIAHRAISEDTASLALEEKEEMESLRAALMHLRPEEKAVFLLRQNGTLTYEEIAELRHSPVGTVKTLMRSALQKLREALQEKCEP